MPTLSEFARGRDVDPKTISAYMKRYNMKYDREKGLSDEQIAILEQKYPLPKPVVIVNGLDPEEERRLRNDLEEALKKLDAAKDKIVELTEKTAIIGLLQDKSNDQQKQIEDQQAEIERLKHRGLLKRILNKV